MKLVPHRFVMNRSNYKQIRVGKLTDFSRGIKEKHLNRNRRTNQ